LSATQIPNLQNHLKNVKTGAQTREETTTAPDDDYEKIVKSYAQGEMIS